MKRQPVAERPVALLPGGSGPMPIVQLLTSAGFFDPAATKILTAAFDTAWQMLETSGDIFSGRLDT
jgi:hypothetical protein